MMRTMLRDEPDAGFSVIEMLVVLLIMTVAGLITLNFLDNTTTVTARAGRHVQAEEDARFALRTLTQELRGANPLVGTYPAGSPSCPATGTFPASYASCIAFEVKRTQVSGQSCPKSRLVYGVRTDGFLREDRTDYDASCTPTRSYTGRQLLSGVQSGSASLFTFYDIDGNALSGTDPLDSYLKAGSVKVGLSVRYQQDAPRLQLSSIVSLRNNR